VLTPDGALVRTFGTAGSGPGQFRLGGRTPVAGGGIAAAGDALLVADTFNDRVQQFTLDGRFVRTIGVGKLKRPQGLTADAHQVLVADDNDHRVVRFDRDGRYVEVGGAYGRGAGQLRYPYDVSLDGARNAWIADDIGGRVVELNAHLAPKATYGHFGHGPGQFAFPRSLAVDPATGRVYVADTANERIQVLNARGRLIGGWGVSGRGPGNVTDPADVAFDALGHLAVADTIDNRIEVLGTDGAHIASRGLRQLDRPSGVAALTDGSLLVSDTFANRVVRLGANGAPVAAFAAGPGGGPGQFRSPHGIAQGVHGEVLIADTGNDRVQRFSADGTYRGAINALHAPQDVAVDDLGRIYVADTAAGAVVQIGLLGTVTRFTGFTRPVAVAVASLQRIWVLDAGTRQVVKLDDRGRRLAAFGAPGALAGEFLAPAGLAVDVAGDVAVADSRNNRVQLFTFGHPAPASTPPAQPAPQLVPAPLEGRLLTPHMALRARAALRVGCRATRPGFCDLQVTGAAGRVLARSHLVLPAPGRAVRTALQLPHAGGSRLRVRAVIGDGSGERILAEKLVSRRAR
jgi:tripartite motif-containing protein 71